MKVLIIEDENLQSGSNVRSRGSEIKAGALAMEKDSVLIPAAIGFLAGIGIKEVKVYPLPSISIIITGNKYTSTSSSLFNDVTSSFTCIRQFAIAKELSRYDSCASSRVTVSPS